MPEYAAVGEVVHIMWAGGREPIGADMEVLPACDAKEGHWYCVKCQQGFEHNLAAMSHYTGSDERLHKFVWICHTHNAPEPPA